MRHCWMGWKISLCKWYTFCVAPWLICCLFVTLLYIERKWLLMRNLATVLPLKSKLSGKFQRFNAVNGSMEMLINSWMSKKIKWTVLKHFKQWATLRKLFSPPSYKSFLRHWNKNFLTEIYLNRYLLSKCFENAVLWLLEMLQCKCFFWHQPETCLLENW